MGEPLWRESIEKISFLNTRLRNYGQEQRNKIEQEYKETIEILTESEKEIKKETKTLVKDKAKLYSQIREAEDEKKVLIIQVKRFEDDYENMKAEAESCKAKIQKLETSLKTMESDRDYHKMIADEYKKTIEKDRKELSEKQIMLERTEIDLKTTKQTQKTIIAKRVKETLSNDPLIAKWVEDYISNMNQYLNEYSDLVDGIENRNMRSDSIEEETIYEEETQHVLETTHIQFTEEEKYAKTDEEEEEYAKTDAPRARCVINDVCMEGKYIQLGNTTKQDLDLSRWKLVQTEDETPTVSYSFGESYILGTNMTVTIYSNISAPEPRDLDDNLVLGDDWKVGPGVQTILYNEKGEIENQELEHAI